MIVSIRGTSKSRNRAYNVTALIATYSALKYGRRSLILPLDDDSSVEEIIIGKQLNETSIHVNDYSFEDSGIDALLRRVEAQRLLKEQFDNCCMPIFSTENLLDIAKKTTKTDLVNEILLNPDSLKNLVEYANDVYDDIYIVSRGKNEDLLKLLNEIADIGVVCIKQANTEDIVELPENHLYLITDYDKNSIYNLRYMKNLYKTKKMTYIPYQSEYKDACNTGTLLNYLSKNQEVNEDDANFQLVSLLDSIIKDYINNMKLVEDKEEKPNFGMDTTEVPEGEEAPLNDIEELPVVVTEQKKGLFGKSQKVVIPKSQLDVVNYIANGIREPDEEIFPESEEVDEDIEEIDEDIDEFDSENSSFDDVDENIDEEIDDDVPFEEEDIVPVEEEPAPVKKHKKKKKKGIFGRKEKSMDDDELFNMDEFYSEDSNDDSMEDFETVTEISNNANYEDSFSDEDDYEPEEVFEPEDIAPAYETPVEEEPAPVKMAPKKTGNGKWICPKCGTLSFSAFCPECGEKRPASEKKTWLCPACGELNPSYSKFCVECGAHRDR